MTRNSDGGGDSRWKDKLSLIYLCRQWGCSACRDVNSCQFRLFGLFADKHWLFFLRKTQRARSEIESLKDGAKEGKNNAQTNQVTS